MLVAGSTGYIGKFVTRELVSRGYRTVALARERSGIKGKMSPEDTRKVLSARGLACPPPPPPCLGNTLMAR